MYCFQIWSLAEKQITILAQLARTFQKFLCHIHVFQEQVRGLCFHYCATVTIIDLKSTPLPVPPPLPLMCVPEDQVQGLTIFQQALYPLSLSSNYSFMLWNHLLCTINMYHSHFLIKRWLVNKWAGIDRAWEPV